MRAPPATRGYGSGIPTEYLMRHSGVVAVYSRGIVLDVRPTGGAGGSRAGRLVTGIRRAEDVGRNGTERLDLVVPNVHAARRARRGRVDQERRQVVVSRAAAAHGERHVRAACDSAWCGVSGEHGDRRTGMPFRAYAAERAIVPHVAANVDDVPRRWGRQTYTRQVALVRWPAAASERNISEPDGVRLTAPCASCQVLHEAVAERDSVSPEQLGHPHHVVFSAPALQPRNLLLGTTGDARLRSLQLSVVVWMSAGVPTAADS